MSESRDPVEGPLGKKLLAALDNSDILKNLNSTELKEIKNWGENNKKAAAAAPDAAAADAAKLEQEAAETIAKDDLGYKDDDLKKGPGKATVEALKVADRIKEAEIEKKPEEIAKIATEMKKITKADGKTKLSNTEIMVIVKKKTEGIGTADKRNGIMQAALDEIDKAKEPVPSAPTPAPTDQGNPTPPAEGGVPPAPAA